MPRQAPKLPLQALPPDKRPGELPPAFEDLLPSGLMATWRMPDPLAILSFDGVIPDPLTAAVIKLLNQEKTFTAEHDPRKFRMDAQSAMGVYGIAAAMLEKPRLDMSVQYGTNGTLGRREIGYIDAVWLYTRFRLGTRGSADDLTSADEPERTTDAPSDSGSVPSDASRAAGDS